MNSGIDKVKSDKERIVGEMKKSMEQLSQMKEAVKKLKKDIITTQSMVDTYNGAVQALDMCLMSLESENKGEEAVVLDGVVV